MLDWLRDFGASIGLAVTGVVLWALPTNTPIVGRPPFWVGAACIIVAAITLILATLHHSGRELQSPVRKRHVEPSSETASELSRVVQPESTAPASVTASDNVREFADATVSELLKLARTEGLTSAQALALLRPHIDKWLPIEGPIDDVSDYGFMTQIVMRIGNDQPLGPRVIAEFASARGRERAVALHKGALVHVQGQIYSIEGYANIVRLKNSEFVD